MSVEMAIRAGKYKGVADLLSMYIELGMADNEGVREYVKQVRKYIEEDTEFEFHGFSNSKPTEEAEK